MTYFYHSLFLLCCLVLAGTCGRAQSPYREQNGLLVIELENADDYDGWETATTIGGATGSGYLHWTGDQFFNQTGNGVLRFPIQISLPGTYRFEWRVAVGFGNNGTEHNDSWLKINGNPFYAEKGGARLKPKPACNNDPAFGCPEGSSTNGFFKIYGGGVNDFRWQARTSDNDAHQIFVDFPTAGNYEIEVNARSSFHAIDRMVLYHSSVSSSTARSLTNPESPRGTNGDLVVSGERKTWHDIALTFTGPNTSETATPNPFADYALNVTFTNGDKTYVVPGYYAADGNAAETSATSGDNWRVHFAPDAPGTWNWSASFVSGTDVAVNGGGTSAGFMDGMTGSFVVDPTDKTGRDHRGKGRLEYVGEHYLRYAGSQEWFVKAGADAPENTLAYEDFDEVPNVKGFRKSWQPHAGDYDPDEAGPYTWQNGRGSELLGAVAYLSGKNVNAFSFLTFNVMGDDRNVFPHLLRVSPEDYGGNDGWTNDVHHDRFDVSRMAQWERIFSYADLKGMYLHFKLQETENDQLMDGGGVGRERKLYFREIIARYAHHLALNWNMGEENTQTTQQRKDMATYFAETDPYGHLRVIHTYPGQKNSVYNPLLGDASDYTGLSLQTSNDNHLQTFTDTKTWVDRSEDNGKKWVVAVDEPGSAQVGTDADPDDRKLIRHRVVWGNFMAGGAGTEFYYGYGTGCTDLTCDNHRTRDQKYTDAAFALRFFQVHFQPYFPAVVNANDLTEDNDDYVLANPDNAYAVYRPDGGTTTITLPSGEWTVAWYNPRTGALSDASTLTGNQLVAPDANDWTALILPADCATGASCNDGNPCTTTDVWDEACNCVGTPLPDGDNDGVCDVEDACPDLDDALLGTSCDDGDPCTVDDVYRTDCSCLGVAPTGQEIELLPIDDAYLEGSNTRVNNAELRIELENRVTYLKFNVPTFSGTPTTASLELNVGSDPGNGTIIAALGDDNGWTETTLSSANAPGEARELGTLNGTFAVGQTYTWTLDPTAITSGPLTIIIRQTSGNDIAVKSAENDDAINHPRLRLSLKEETLPEGCVTLPLQWSTFDARPDGKNVALDWRTSAEENIGGFLVHHATDGRNWATIGEVSSDLAAIDGEYGFHHLAPGPGTHYYRIVAREPDGTENLSPVREVTFTEVKDEVLVFPNPFKHSLRIRFAADLADLELFNAYGVQVWSSPTVGESPVTLEFPSLPAGIYWLRGTSDNRRWTRRIIKR